MSFSSELLIKVLVVLATAPVMALGLTLLEVKGSAWMQRRPGPLHVGLRGFIFPLATAAKYFQKETIIPKDVDEPVFKWAPAWVIAAVVGLFTIIPLSPTLIVRDLELGVFFLLAISSISTIGVLTAGWSSANKFSLMGGLRAAGQLIAYELPLILSVVGVVIQAETMSTVGIVEKQIEFGFPFVIAGQGIAFIIFMIAATAEMMRTPFDMPIGESELTMGFMTEYSGIRFLIFYISEYINLFVMCAIASTLFLGGYHIPLLPTEWVNFYGPLVLIGKTFTLAFLLIAIRWSFPRFREDQLQTLAWKVLIPLSLLNIMVTAIMKVVFNAKFKPRIPGFLIGLKSLLAICSRPFFLFLKIQTSIILFEKEVLAPRTRGVIALDSEACTSCMLCARSCPDWCIYIEGHKELQPPSKPGGRQRSRAVLDRFDIDYALCMYCGICVEVCPFDALFWSPEYEYSEFSMGDMLHDKDRLDEWLKTVPESPGLES